MQIKNNPCSEVSVMYPRRHGKSLMADHMLDSLSNWPPMPTVITLGDAINSADMDYEFYTSSKQAVDYELLSEEIDRDNPLAIVHVTYEDENKPAFSRAVIHKSIWLKAEVLGMIEQVIDRNRVVQLRNTYVVQIDTENTTNVRRWVKQVKLAKWPEKDRGVKVSVSFRE